MTSWSSDPLLRTARSEESSCALRLLVVGVAEVLAGGTGAAFLPWAAVGHDAQRTTE